LADEIRINNIRPSRILAMLTGKTKHEMVQSASYQDAQAHIPDGVKVKADDKRGVLIAEGPKAAVEEFARLVSLFDVMPRTVTADITIDAPIEKFTGKTSTTIRNNETYTVGQDSIGLSLAITPRINDDNTVTVLIRTGQKSGGKSYVFRTKYQKVVQIVTDDLLAAIENNNVALSETAAGFQIGKKNEMSTVVTLVMLPPKEDAEPKAIPPQALSAQKSSFWLSLVGR
jgi:type II secretory pathway component GspD/PulD (secretin)